MMRILAFELIAALLLTGASAAVPKLDGAKVAGRSRAFSRGLVDVAEELSAEELLAAEEPVGEDLEPAAPGSLSFNEENAAILRRIATLERLSAEQDTLLAQLTRGVKDLGALADKQEAAEESCRATPPKRCEHCA
mmetsp:Transcript_77297/g.198970  ORF Transcript_77297/g.198970 Transcript_77297/m.198970 type:complete len:136 (-) Transcript_77297:108-515(-)